jgi:hypothetical protein
MTNWTADWTKLAAAAEAVQPHKARCLRQDAAAYDLVQDAMSAALDDAGDATSEDDLAARAYRNLSVRLAERDISKDIKNFFAAHGVTA